MEKRFVHTILLFLTGIIAALVDGATGSGFGLVSNSLLLTIGFSSAIASATVHFAEMATTFISGISHWSFGNIHLHILWPLTISGVIGGVFGAYVAVNYESTRWIKLFIGIMLLIMGIFMIGIFHTGKIFKNRLTKKIGYLIGFPAAMVDAIVGGGWGPFTAPTLMFHGSHARHAIGTASASEFFVTLAISAAFYVWLPHIDYTLVIPLVIGAILTAPLAAWITKKLPHHALGVAVGVIIIVISIRNIIQGLF